MDVKKTVRSVSGEEIDSKIIFIHAFKCILAKAMEAVNNKFGEGFVKDAKDIRWVVTVPAIWSDKAKNFMKYCAAQGGLISEGIQHVKDHLIIAYEVDCAAMCIMVCSLSSFHMYTLFRKTLYGPRCTKAHSRAIVQSIMYGTSTLYGSQCTAHNVQSTMYGPHMYCPQCTVHKVQSTTYCPQQGDYFTRIGRVERFRNVIIQRRKKTRW